GIGLAAAAGGTVETKPEGAEAKPAEGVLLVSAAVLVLAAVSIGPAGSGPLLVPVLAAALLAAHDLAVGGLHFLELFFGGGVIGVQVGVVLFALLPVRLFDGFVIRAGADTQYAVRISHWRRPSLCFFTSAYLLHTPE